MTISTTANHSEGTQDHSSDHKYLFHSLAKHILCCLEGLDAQEKCTSDWSFGFPLGLLQPFNSTNSSN